MSRRSMLFHAFLSLLLASTCCLCSSSNLVVVSSSSSNSDQQQRQSQERDSNNQPELRQNRVNFRDGNQQANDLTTFFMDLVLASPVGVAANMVAPTAVKGLQTDFSNNYGLLSNGFQSNYGLLHSSASSMGESALKRIQDFQANLAQRVKTNQQLFEQAYEAVTNPREYCSNFQKAQDLVNQAGQSITQQGAQQLENMGSATSSNLQQAADMANQAGKQSSMLFNKLGSSRPFSGFGK